MRILAFIVWAILLAASTCHAAGSHSAKSLGLEKKFQDAFRSLYMTRFGLEGPKGERQLNTCIVSGNSRCLKLFKYVMDAKHFLQEQIRQDPHHALELTLDTIFKLDPAPPPGKRRDLHDEAVSVGATFALYFFSTEEQDQILFQRMEHAPPAVLDRVFDGVNEEWLYNRPDPERWIPFINALPDSILTSFEKESRISSLKTPPLEKSAIMLEWPEEKTLKSGARAGAKARTGIWNIESLSLEQKFQEAFRTLYVSRLLGFTGERQLDFCILTGDTGCLNVFKSVIGAKNFLQEQIRRDPHGALELTLDTIFKLDPAPPPGMQRDFHDELGFVGATIALYFFYTEEQDRMIFQRMEHAPPAVLHRVFDSSNVDWLYNRPDPERWISFINALPDSIVRSRVKWHLSSCLETPPFDKSVIMLERPEKKMLKSKGTMHDVSP